MFKLRKEEKKRGKLSPFHFRFHFLVTSFPVTSFPVTIPHTIPHKCDLSCPSILLLIGNMHVRECHENTQRNVTIYRYVLEYMAT